MLPHSCSGCPTRWGGYLTSHCAACHQTFVGVKLFDSHREGSHGKGRRCVDPAEVGMVDAGRAYPCWGMPGMEVDDYESYAD